MAGIVYNSIPADSVGPPYKNAGIKGTNVVGGIAKCSFQSGARVVAFVLGKYVIFFVSGS